MNISKKMSLIEVIRSFIEYATNQGEKSFPPMFYGPWWHELLYQVREQIPEFSEIIGKFDWDAAYPRNRRLKDFASSIGYSFFARTRSCDNRLILTNTRNNQIQEIPADLIEKLFFIAKQMPDFFENQDAA